MHELENRVRYYDDNSWNEYFKSLAEFYERIKGLLKLRESLEEALKSEPVNILISRSEIYKEILLGGLGEKESKPFSDNALALFYKRILGIGLKTEDSSKLISRRKEGLSLDEATKDMYCTSEDTNILRILQKISLLLEIVFNRLESINVIGKPKPKEYVLENSGSEIGLHALLEVLNAAKKILPRYNPLSFFIVSIYSVPRFYINKIYTNLFKEGTQLLLRKYDIYIGKLLEPGHKKDEYEIIGLQENCIGYIIRQIIQYIYLLFQEEELKRFFKIEDEFNKYVLDNVENLRNSIYTDRFNDIINKIYYVSYSSQKYCLDYKTEKGCLKIDSYDYTYRYMYEKSKVIDGIIEIERIEKERLNYTEFFAFLAPQMFLGLAYVRPNNGSKEFKWACILGWEK